MCAPSTCHSIPPHQERMLPSCGAHSWPLRRGDSPPGWGQELYRARRALCGLPGSRSHPSPRCLSRRCASPVTAAAGGVEQAPRQQRLHAQPPAMATISPLSLLRRAGMSPSARGALFPFPSGREPRKSHRGAARMGRTPHTAPGAQCSPGPAFPSLCYSSPTQHLGRAVRNHHLIQVHLARHHWGCGGFHPTCCRTAGFLYHLQRQPPEATQNGPESQGYFPWLSTLPPHCQSQAEPHGERSWSLQDGTVSPAQGTSLACLGDCTHLGPFKTPTSFADFVRDFGNLRGKGLGCQAAQSSCQHRTPHEPPFYSQAQCGLPQPCKITRFSHIWGNSRVCGVRRGSFPTCGPFPAAPTSRP